MSEKDEFNDPGMSARWYLDPPVVRAEPTRILVDVRPNKDWPELAVQLDQLRSTMLTGWFQRLQIRVEGYFVEESIRLSEEIQPSRGFHVVRGTSKLMGLQATLTGIMPDRDSGIPTPFQMGHRIPIRSFLTMGSTMWLREVLMQFSQHEADEALVVGGRRVFDPHRQRQTALYQELAEEARLPNIDPD